MKTVYVFNGPNLNLLGTREPGIYGAQTLADVQALCEQAAARQGLALDFRQTNHEGALVDWLQEAGLAQAAGAAIGVVLNAGAYTHTSVALADAIKGAGVTVIELHISNVHAREAFRHHSFISPVASGIVVGLGVAGYALAIEGLAMRSPIATSPSGEGLAANVLESGVARLPSKK
jgi:3-dehydroquinate dehydratase-2